MLDRSIKRWPWITHLFGDVSYDPKQLVDEAASLDFTVEILQSLQRAARFCYLATTLGGRTNVCMANALPAFGLRPSKAN